MVQFAPDMFGPRGGYAMVQRRGEVEKHEGNAEYQSANGALRGPSEGGVTQEKH